jgi:hypothetical protein
MPGPTLGADEVVRRGQEIYERDIRALVEPEHRGEFIVIDLTTRQYEIDAREAPAIRRAIAKNPDGPRCVLRIGYPYTHRIGGTSLRLGR